MDFVGIEECSLLSRLGYPNSRPLVPSETIFVEMVGTGSGITNNASRSPSQAHPNNTTAGKLTFQGTDSG